MAPGYIKQRDTTTDYTAAARCHREPAPITVYDYVDLKAYIAGLFDGSVDVVNRDGLKPYVRPAATADAVYAF